MAILNIIKIVTAIISVSLSLIVGTKVLSLNPDNLLNRWFAAFFLATSGGFSFYTIYHFILNNAKIIIPLMITAQIFYNFLFVSLVMTVFVLEKYKEIAMSFKYLGSMIIIFLIMSVGYFIFLPELDEDLYAIGIVDTDTFLGLFIFVNSIRIGLAVYVVYKYGMMVKKVGEETKKRVQWLFIGIFIVIIGVILNLIGGIFKEIGIEIIALIAIDIGIIALFKGFLIK